MNTENNRRAGLPEMLQDCDRKLSMALSNTPGARLHATEAAAAVNSKPVAWIEHHKAGDNLNWEQVDHPYAMATPLYTAPMTALSYEQIDAIAKAQDDDPQEPWFTRQLTKLEWRCFARDIERACSPGAAPPADTAIEPLSDEQIEPLFRQINDMRVVGEKDEWFWFAWGVEMGERAHGIRSSGARHSADTDRLRSDEKESDDTALLRDAVAKGYTGSTLVTDFHGPKVTLRYSTNDEAERAHAALCEAIDVKLRERLKEAT
jgi:hypothetical protein